MSTNPAGAKLPRTDTLELRVRYSEVDQMGVVYHPNYLSYFEMGRVEMLRRMGVAYRDLEDSGSLIVVVKAEVRYRAPARYDDELILETTLERVGLARIDHSYKLFRKNPRLLLAEGATTLACVNRAGEVCPIPEAIRCAE